MSYREWDVSKEKLPNLTHLSFKFVGKKGKKNVCDKEQFYIEENKYRWIPRYDSEMIALIKDAKQRIQECGMESCDQRGMIEFHYYNVEGKCKSIFDDHEDDNGGVSYKVNTVIYYLIKSDTIKGGDLKIGKKTIDVRPLADCYKIICFAGNVTHQVTSMNGTGQRLCIVVQLYCLDR